MKEQEIYKNILKKLIDQTERFQIKNSEEMVQKLIHELDRYELPKAQKQAIIEQTIAK